MPKFRVQSQGLPEEKTAVLLFPLDVTNSQARKTTLFVADEFLGGDEVLSRILTKDFLGLLLTVVEKVGLGPFGPRVVWGTFVRRARHDFELGDALTTVADGGTHAVGAGVAATENDDVLTLEYPPPTQSSQVNHQSR